MKSLLLNHVEPQERRLGAALLLALLVHGTAVLGLGFTVTPRPPNDPVTALNVSLIEQTGGEPGPALPAPTETPPEPVASSPSRTPPAPPEPPAPEPIEPPPSAIATAAPADAPEPALPEPELPEPTGIEPESSEPAKPLQTAVRQPTESLPRAADLMSRGLQMARLASKPKPSFGDAREKYLDPESATTAERFYIENWRRKVERVGELNFPEEAHRRSLTGKLTLDVALRANGTVQSIQLMRSSGHTVLDDAAFRIVHLAAPYAPFPPELRRQYDVLHIVRTWVFDPGNRLLAQ